MPRLNTEQLMERIQKRIHQLELGEEIAAKDIKALLNAEQQQQLADALAAQVALKKNKRARTDAEKQAWGWKSIREVRLDVLRSALNAANDGLLEDYERRLNEKEVRQANIYLREYSDARKADKSVFAAQGAANNALTRAALPRVDGQDVNSMSQRDREVKAIGDWKIGSSTVTHEIDVIHAKYITGVAGADATTVATLQGLKKRVRTADVACEEMTTAFVAATMLWSISSKKEIRNNISKQMATKKPNDYIEIPELDITKDCKKLVAEIKKLNVLLRDVQRGKETIKDCYAKRQTMYILEHSKRNTALDILMK